LAKLTLSTFPFVPLAPRIVSQYATVLTPDGPFCGPFVTPGAGAGVVSPPGVVVLVEPGAVAVGVGVTWVLGLFPGCTTKTAKTLKISPRIITTAAMANQKFLLL